MVLDFYSWVYVTYLFRDLQYHPTSMGWGSRSLRWLIPFSWSLHRIGCPDIRTQICCGRATAFFPSTDDIDMLVNQWLQFTCSHSYLAIEAYSSRCGLARNVHPRLCSSIPFQDASWNSTPFSPRRDPRSSEATLWTIWRAWEVKTRMGILMRVEAQTWNIV